MDLKHTFGYHQLMDGVQVTGGNEICEANETGQRRNQQVLGVGELMSRGQGTAKETEKEQN